MSHRGGDRKERIAIIGTTGALGGGLALRFARARLSVIVGSRDAAREGEIVIVAVPFQNQRATSQEIAAQVTGKIVVDTTVALVPPKVARVQLPRESSATEKHPHDEAIDCDLVTDDFFAAL